MRLNKRSEGYINYVKGVKREKRNVLFYQLLILIGFIVIWELLADLNVINTFLFSKPSDIYNLFIQYAFSGQLFKHIGISVYETVLGLVIGTVLGILVVLKDVNFNLKEGEILTLLGPSGSGKSTILNILTNLLKPTSGDIKITGNIGYMFQKDNLLEWRNIMDNITIGLEIQGKKDKKSLDRVESLLKTYGLWDFRSMYPKELSGGMRQRVALIRTLSVNPDILLLDEPFSALDYQTRLLVCDDVYSIIKNENKSTILVTHDIGEAISISDKVAILSKRPATIKNIYDIELNMDGTKTPLKTRKVPDFQKYFDILWKELDTHEA
ncbi:ATP-binding cassette domain-containing protein [Clostridioides difficile]|uniref:ATP-binding cassette domain-containing protein n=5 Tax=Clostridioides difficile TaxID=1496 RepID=UPI0010250FAB|nr:ABC transporter ATP-binding protein [Clostridioides difficile]